MMITFLLAAYGLTLIVTQSKLFAGFRSFVKRRSEWLGTLVHCPMCFGWWAGVFWALVGLWPTQPFLCLGHWPTAVVNVLAAGCVASGTSWIVRVILHHLHEDEL